MVSVHKWFARRPGSLFRALALCELVDAPLALSYECGHELNGVCLDPFMGGGTPLLEAARLGMSVIGFDTNPMARWIVERELEDVDPDELARVGAHAECPHHHRIVVWLLRYTGVRVGETRALTVADLDLTPEGEALTVRGSKTRAATRTIPLLPKLLPLIHEHLDFLRGRLSVTPDIPLLATNHGTPMTTNYLWRVVKRVAFDAGVRPIACICGTERQDRHDRCCPRTKLG